MDDDDRNHIPNDEGGGDTEDHADRLSTTGKTRQGKLKRACDKCSASRTRCIGDGEFPCRRCVEYSFACEYKRVLKKRGKPSRSNQAADSDGQEVIVRRSSTCPPQYDMNNENLIFASENPAALAWDATTSQTPPQHQDPVAQSGFTFQTPRNDHDQYMDILDRHSPTLYTGSELTSPFGAQVGQVSLPQEGTASTGTPSVLPNSSSDKGLVFNTLLNHSLRGNYEETNSQLHHSCRPSLLKQNQLPAISLVLPPNTTQRLGSQVGNSVTARSYLRWPELTNIYQPTTSLECRYPVLRPLLPHIVSIISPSDTCDLLDLYFTEPSGSIFEPASPYVVAQIFRKKSFLCADKPRPTTPGLLATMIWVVSQTSTLEVLRSEPRARARICNELYGVCEVLLALEEKGKSHKLLGDGNNNFRDMDSRAEQGRRFDCPIVPQQNPITLDSILAYALIGTVISGSETRKECLRWWTKAWNSAKELGLNREQGDDEAREFARQKWDLKTSEAGFGWQGDSIYIVESREERRRIWWLLYMADRHLALCYNSPLSILDAECHVYQPLDNLTWQDLDNKSACDIPERYFGPCTTILGSDVFEYFLPLMAILGDVVDIHQWGRHPRFAHIQRETAVLQTERVLDLYEKSLEDFEAYVRIRFHKATTPAAVHSPYNISSNHKPQPLSPEHTRLRTIIGYSKYLLHVLHILLHGSWDPVDMIDGSDWITPSSFVNCATHTISAAATVAEILELDPELNFMPYLFGIYLLHGSFILLIFADRMDMATSETIIQAVETTNRAHEVCVVTLNTEYQRTFRKVLRSALCNVRGTIPFEAELHKARRREFLMMYRWDREGRGLAI